MNTYYVILIDFLVDDDPDVHCVAVEQDYETAVAVFKKYLKSVLDDYKDELADWIIEYDGDTSYTAYADGEYSVNHLNIWIETVNNP